MITATVQRVIDQQVENSTEWLGEHTQPKYAHAANCEKCFLGGMAFVLSAINGTTQESEYQKMTASAPKPRKKTVKKPVKKKIVVRRKK